MYVIQRIEVLFLSCFGQIKAKIIPLMLMLLQFAVSSNKGRMSRGGLEAITSDYTTTMDDVTMVS
uniref:Uncharacterized protein n=1 Tax=Anopheles atroparvus TaxID=41427 RepID=A0AAG5CXR5_ANOAO